jgi:hypothetical protein
MADFQGSTDLCPEPSLANLKGQSFYSRAICHGKLDRDTQLVACIFPRIVPPKLVLLCFHANRLEGTSRRILTMHPLGPSPMRIRPIFRWITFPLISDCNSQNPSARLSVARGQIRRGWREGQHNEHRRNFVAHDENSTLNHGQVPRWLAKSAHCFHQRTDRIRGVGPYREGDSQRSPVMAPELPPTKITFARGLFETVPSECLMKSRMCGFYPVNPHVLRGKFLLGARFETGVGSLSPVIFNYL